MLIIPAIDIRGGKCVRLFQGEYGKETLYGEDPAAMARRWIGEGARFIHIVDLDGARQGIPVNREVIRSIVEMSPVPVQIGGGIRTMKTVDDYLSAGAKRVIIGTAAFADPPFLKGACEMWPDRIAVDIAAKNGLAAVSGWTKNTEVRAIDLALQGERLGAAVIIYTDILRDGTQKGVNLHATRDLARALRIPVIASGGVSTIEDLEALKPLGKEGVCAVIIGRALYEGTLKLRDAMALTGCNQG